MELLRFLFRSSRHMMLGLVAASFVSGAASAALIAIIHRALEPDGLDMRMIGVAFLVAVFVKATTQFVAQVTLVKFGQGVVLEICRSLCDRVLAAPLARLESMGSARLLATLNDDVAVLSGAVQSAPAIATNLAMLAGCSVYLVFLSWQAFVLSVSMVVIGVIGYRMLLLRAHGAIQASRESRDRLFGTFRTLIDGIKELKLNRDRREAFVRDEIDEATETLRRQNVGAIRQYLVADIWSQLLFFALIAMLLFGATTLAAMPAASLTGYVFAALYMMTPIWSLVGTVPTFMRGKVSLDKIRELDAALLAPSLEERAQRAVVPATPHIEIEAATYAYPAPAGEDHGFVLGPIDLRLGPGEVVFVTGGNGCGKSTLVRLLTGLYVPSAGRIVSHGVIVDDGNREAYLQQFAAVFADFHLFERLFGLDAPDRAETIQAYLKVLGMEHKVRVQSDRLSTTALSSGQRRRLALLTAYLEDRPVYVFDEWAADQDPNYKQVFYQRLLPELKARGKCVVVVTHDDRYFHLGDRIVKLEAGRIVEEVRPEPTLHVAEPLQPQTT
jgi:putative pyoverdin transport system ATP-binding/permease protein